MTHSRQGIRLAPEKIRHLRVNDLAMTQAQFAAVSGISERSLRNVESGKPVSVETLRTLASAFGVSPKELIAEQSDVVTRLTIDIPQNASPDLTDKINQLISDLGDVLSECSIKTETIHKPR